MNISEFAVADEGRSEYDQLISDFKAMGVRCVSKTYDDDKALKYDIERLRYRIGQAGGKCRWLVVSKKGLELRLINTEVEA